MTSDIIKQMIDFHRSDPNQKHEMSDEELEAFFNHCMFGKRLMVHTLDNGQINAYLEYTRINFEQLGLLVLGCPITSDLYDEDGMVIFIANLLIKQSDPAILLTFRRKLLEENPNCHFIVGHHQAKNLKPFSVHHIKR